MKQLKICYKYDNKDTADVSTGEMSSEEVENALKDFPAALRRGLHFNDKGANVELLKKEYSSNYIIVQVTSCLTEIEFNEALTKVLKYHFLSVDDVG